MLLNSCSPVFLLLLSSFLLLVSANDIDPVCAKALSRNSTHKHLNKYLGYVSSGIEGVHTDKIYTYKVGICTSPDSLFDATCGILQYDRFLNGTIDPKSTKCIGRISSTQVAETKDHVWTEVTYTQGDQYGSHCGKEKRKGRIVFVCDPLIPGKGKFEFLEENRDDDLCYYLFTVASRDLCSSTILSPGDIILIIFACLIAVWLIAMAIGFLYKRFIAGAKGWEQIPLITYYREFGNLEADGCDLVCRSSSSSPPSRFKHTMPAGVFATETDEETDEEKDDNLLPM